MGGINYKDVTLETEPIDYYLGRQHRVDLACGCALPTLSPEVIRSDSRVRCAYQTELLKLKGAISAGLGYTCAASWWCYRHKL